MVHRVVHRERVHLDEPDVHGGVGEELQVPVHQVFAHGEDAHLDVRRVGVLEELVAPLHVVQREGDLLDGLEPDDLGDLAPLDGRELDEAGEAGLPAHADGDFPTLGEMALGEVRQRRLDEGVAVVAGLGQDRLVLDDLKVIDAQARVLADQLDGLECPVSDIDAPGETGGGHALLL